MLKKIRTILAVVCFALITLLFLDFTGTLHCWLSWLAKIQFLPAVMALNVVVVAALIILTLVFGRIYCSVICPLGVFQDLLARFHRKKNKYSYSKEVRWLRYPVLGLFIIALVAGVGAFFQLLAPYSAYGRIATMIFQPVWKFGNNILATIAERTDSYAFYSVDTWMRSMPVFVIAAVTLVVLFVMAWRGGRTYCNTICPVGTFLSFFARFSWLKIHFDEEKCKNCSLWQLHCLLQIRSTEIYRLFWIFQKSRISWHRRCFQAQFLAGFGSCHYRCHCPEEGETDGWWLGGD